ncbi:hypothetical protein TSAR_000693, partial [Trichomalopsis sarcophagae]
LFITKVNKENIITKLQKKKRPHPVFENSLTNIPRKRDKETEMLFRKETEILIRWLTQLNKDDTISDCIPFTSILPNVRMAKSGASLVSNNTPINIPANIENYSSDDSLGPNITKDPWESCRNKHKKTKKTKNTSLPYSSNAQKLFNRYALRVVDYNHTLTNSKNISAENSKSKQNVSWTQIPTIKRRKPLRPTSLHRSLSLVTMRIICHLPPIHSTPKSPRKNKKVKRHNTPGDLSPSQALPEIATEMHAKLRVNIKEKEHNGKINIQVDIWKTDSQ